MTPLAQTVLSLIEEGWHFGKPVNNLGNDLQEHDPKQCEAITKRLLDALKESEE